MAIALTIDLAIDLAIRLAIGLTVDLSASLSLSRSDSLSLSVDRMTCSAISPSASQSAWNNICNNNGTTLTIHQSMAHSWQGLARAAGWQSCPSWGQGDQGPARRFFPAGAQSARSRGIT